LHQVQQEEEHLLTGGHIDCRKRHEVEWSVT
jgi:hypothetical protein